MIKKLAESAHELDQWLHIHAGRTYVAILTWGLVLSIISSISAIGRAFSRGSFGLTPLFILVIQAGLLVNQLAQWHDLRQRRRNRKPAAIPPGQ
jgi:hypothetical protein